MRPKTFHNCFVLNTLSSKAKQLRIFLGLVLGQDFIIQNQSFSQPVKHGKKSPWAHVSSLSLQLGVDTLEKASSYSVVLPTLRELKIDLKYLRTGQFSQQELNNFYVKSI